MKIERFEDIKAWQKARELNFLIHQLFKDSKDYKFRDQIQSAAVSITNNIAEGFERQGDKELARFLFIAKGSCGEVRSMCYLALDAGYLSQENFDKVYTMASEVSRILSGFIKSL